MSNVEKVLLACMDEEYAFHNVNSLHHDAREKLGRSVTLDEMDTALRRLRGLGFARIRTRGYVDVSGPPRVASAHITQRGREHLRRAGR